MKIPFGQIGKSLEDPFFEVRTLGKDAVRMRTFQVNKFGAVPDNLRFIEWAPEDDFLTVRYAFHDTAIGRVLLACTSKGLCFLGFACKGGSEVKADFFRRFPKQQMNEEISDIQNLAAEYCNGNREFRIPLHMKGTGFQIGIWKQLVRIPEGMLSTYGSLSDDPGAAQAVGSAVGSNPVSYIVPCHRVVKGDGSIHGYHWGADIKKQLLAYELQNGF